MEELYVLDQVSVGYGGEQVVLRAASMTLRAGECVGLRGANGAGKSTLLESMVGLIPLYAGAMRIFGRACVTEQDFVGVRRRVGLLFEDPDDQLFHITVAEDIAFGPFNLGWDRTRVREVVTQALNLFGLAGYEERVTYRLSRGEKRLVALATLWAMAPDVLLLDEPTAGLDHEHVARLINVIEETSAAMLIVSHDESFLRQVTGRSVKIVDSRLVDDA